MIGRFIFQFERSRFANVGNGAERSKGKRMPSLIGPATVHTLAERERKAHANIGNRRGIDPRPRDLGQ